MDLSDPGTWRPALDALASGIPAGAPGVVHSIAVEPGSAASQTWTEGVGQGFGPDGVGDAEWTIVSMADSAFGARLRVGADRAEHVMVYPWPPAVEPGVGIGPGVIHLVPGADISHVLHPDPEVPAVTLSHASSATALDAADPGIGRLVVGAVTGPVDLAPLAGHPEVRFVRSFLPAMVVDPTVFGTLRAVELLHLPAEDWRALLAADAVPTSLLAAVVDASAEPDALGSIEIANRLLTRWGQSPIAIHTVVDRPGSS